MATVFFSQAKGVGIAQLAEHLTEKPGTMLTRVQVPSAARDFLPESTFSTDSLMVSVRHISTSVLMLKISSVGIHTVVWKHENTTQTDGNG